MTLAVQKILSNLGEARRMTATMSANQTATETLITEADVRKVAQLARLQLSDAEVKATAGHLRAVLDAFANISVLPTEGVLPLVTPVDPEHPWREDAEPRGLGADAVLEQAPARLGNSFKVPPVVG